MSVASRDYALANGTSSSVAVDKTSKTSVGGKPVDPSSAGGKAANRLANGQPESVESLKRHDEAKGANVLSFDPDASTEQKKQAALLQAGVGKLGLGANPKEGLKKALSKKGQGANAQGGTGLKTDIGGRTNMPTISMAEVQKASAAEGQSGILKDGPTSPTSTSVPGDYADGPAGIVPGWYKSQYGMVQDPTEIAQRDTLEGWLSDMYYGHWWHNAAVIFFAVAASHYATIFGGSWTILGFILAACSTYYTTSTRRVRRNIRDDVTRSLARTRLFTDSETVDWMNSFLQRFWFIYEPVLSATIVASVNNTLDAACPSFLDSLTLSNFTLGTKAPRIDFIKSHPGVPDDEVVMDLRLSFTPMDTADMTVRAAKDKINPKIVLAVRFGKAFVGVTKNIVVEDLMFRGFLRTSLKLVNNFPHIQTVNLSFLEKPDFDFKLNPVGFDINMIPGLSGFIHSQVHANLGPMMYDPNFFSINLEQMLAGAPIDTAVGVLQITVYYAQGIKATKIGGGVPDPYISFGIAGKAPMDRTKIKHSTSNPHWNSTHFLLINSLSDVLALSVMDYNSTRKDNQLGVANFDLQSLNADAEQEGVVVPILADGKSRGEVRFDATFYPCLVPKKLENGQEEPIPDTSTGVVRVTIHQAKDLDPRRTSTNNVAAYGELFVNAKKVHKSQVIKRTVNPAWESFTEILISDKSSATIGVRVMDEKAGEDPMMGFVNVRLADILEANAKQQDWFPLIEGKRGKIRLSAVWKPVLMTGAINGAGAYRPPIGVLRFWFKRGVDLKNVEALTGGKSDPYVRVLRSGIVLTRTAIFNNNLDPEFDEICYVPVHDIRDVMRIELMDYQHLTKDRSLGFTDLSIKDLVVPVEDSSPFAYKSTGSQSLTSRLQSDRKGAFKGSIVFDADFYPCTDIKWSPFDAPESSFDKAKDAAGADDDKASTINEPLEEGGNMEEDKEMLEHLAKVASGKSQIRAKSGEAVEQESEAEAETDKEVTTGDEKAGRTGAGAGSVDMSREQILQCQSGVLVFNIMGGELARRNARLEVLFDDGYWPTYSTEPSRSNKAKWDETGTGFIRELDWSQIILKLNTAEKETREEVYASYTSTLKSFLDDCLEKPFDFILMDLEGGSRSKVTIQCKYIPVPITLEARESVNNMGMLTVMVDNAKGLKAADRNGYSDPYIEFKLNGMKVFKSETKKKTLNPTWDEKFQMEVPSRFHADFRCSVFDWDRVGTADKLGNGRIKLMDLEPLTQTPVAIALSDTDSPSGLGTVHLRLSFRPGFVIRSRQATSTFSGGLGRAATGLGGGVLTVGQGIGGGVLQVGGGVLTVGHGVGHAGVGTVKGVGKGVAGVGKLGFSGVRKATGHGRQHSTVTDDGTLLEGSAVTAAIAPTNAAGHGGNAAGQGPNSYQGDHGPGGPGKLSVTVVGASGLLDTEHKQFVTVKFNSKKLDDTKSVKQGDSPTWDETFTVDTGEGPAILQFIVNSARTLGKAKEQTRGGVDVWQYVHSATGQTSAEVPLALSDEGGQLRIRLSFKPSSGAGFLDNDPASEPHSPDGTARSVKSARFSLYRGDRERTPASVSS